MLRKDPAPNLVTVREGVWLAALLWLTGPGLSAGCSQRGDSTGTSAVPALKAEAADWVITPGQGVGKVWLDAPISRVIEQLGPPDAQQNRAFAYTQLGLIVFVSKEGSNVNEILCGDLPPTSKARTDEPFKPVFVGKISGQAGLGCNLKALEHALGAASDRIATRSELGPGAFDAYFTKFGIRGTFLDDRLQLLSIRKPK